MLSPLFARLSGSSADPKERVLVIVESPAKAKTIQKFAPSNFIIDSSVGHIRQLTPKRDDKDFFLKYKDKVVVPELKLTVADFGVDVEENFTPIYSIIKNKKEVVDRLRKTMGQCSQILLATDEDREGEVRLSPTHLNTLPYSHMPLRCYSVPPAGHLMAPTGGPRPSASNQASSVQ